MKYLIINPYYKSNDGIQSYINNLKKYSLGIEFEILENTKNKNPAEFRIDVLNFVKTNYGYDDVIIEAPEARAATLLLPRKYKVHIRMHCPLAVAQKYDFQHSNQIEFSHELRAISKAGIVSSPSYGLINELSEEIDGEDFFVFKNPIDINVTAKEERAYDVVFMGRNQRLKGVDFLNQILERFPENYRVLIFGRNFSEFKKSPYIKCSVEIRDAVNGEKRFDLIRDCKCLMQLSHFENCSMVILESLACHVPVVCWDVGGNKEIADRNLLRAIPYGDVNTFVDNIRDFVEKENFLDEKFSEWLILNNDDFINGFRAVISAFKGETGIIYRGHSLGVKESRKIGHVRDIQFFDKRIRALGIAYSNEHAEQLWAPVLKALDFDFRFISRRPLGYRKVFDFEFSDYNKNHFLSFDWIKNKDRLISSILRYKPHFLLFHNGAHPSYQAVLKEIKSLNIPIIYSELGWLPQRNHVYFDDLGVNGASRISKEDFFDIFSENVVPLSFHDFIHGKTLLALQNENDTNIINFSDRFKKNESLIRYVFSQIGNKTKLLVKPHPLDKNDYSSVVSELGGELIVGGSVDEILGTVDSVVALNSTLLIEALRYPVNIYCLGLGILNNKKVVFDCTSAELSDIWKDKYFNFGPARDNLLDFFMKKQVNVFELSCGEEINDFHRSFFINSLKLDISPLISLENSRKIVQKSSSLVVENNKSSEKISGSINITLPVDQKSKVLIHKENTDFLFRRKLRKLVRDPNRFFMDFIKKRRWIK